MWKVYDLKNGLDINELSTWKKNNQSFESEGGTKIGGAASVSERQITSDLLWPYVLGVQRCWNISHRQNV